ncbi:hypothetical protein [Lentzea terrae]|uniref:hypothetical protein n=1 Tax=Lentzea terrae TaxID=2200761 RepID=UPI000DD499D7|nr:hypothetical protein [Lentzea terrae]
MITRLLTVAALTAASVAVPGGALAVPAPFHDNFDGAVHNPLTNGLNDNLRQRQGTGAVTYSRVAGGSVHVNDPRRPGTLSMRGDTTAVRLDAPSTGSTISAKLTPAADGWSSIVLARSANITGHPSGQDIDLGFRLRANGTVEISQPGKPVVSTSVTPRNSFAVTLKLSGAALDVTVNGEQRNIALGAEVPTERLWVYLGSGSATTASLVDDLKIEALNSDHLRKRLGATLRYYGYLGARAQDVRGHSNLNLVEVGASAAAERHVDGFVVRDAGTARQIKKLFPGKKVVFVVAGPAIDDAFQPPAEADAVAFHDHCAGYVELEERMTKLEQRAPGKELFLMPEGSPQAPCADRTDADLESTQYMHLALAQQYPSFVGFLVTPVPATFARTADAQERVAALVLGDARLSG